MEYIIYNNKKALNSYYPSINEALLVIDYLNILDSDWLLIIIKTSIASYFCAYIQVIKQRRHMTVTLYILSNIQTLTPFYTLQPT